MPELPEVEHVKRGLEPYIIGEKIVSVIFSEKVHQSHSVGKQAILKGMSIEQFTQLIIDYTSLVCH